jgi:YVTN family beta-propeller protein
MSRSALLLGIVSASLFPLTIQAQEKARFAGPTENGFLLPNGWTISPAGRQVPLPDMPLNIVPLPDGRHALVASSGFNEHALALVDLYDQQVVSKQTARNSWFGLALSPDKNSIWWSGGGFDRLHTFALQDAKLVRTSESESSKREGKASAKNAPPKGFRSGIAVDERRQRLYSLDINRGTIAPIALADGSQGPTVRCGDRPYDVVLAPNGTQLFVSDWAKRMVLVLDAVTLRVVNTIGVGEHPNQIAVHPRDGRLFVACASSNCVSVIDTERGTVTETIVTSLFPRAPEGSTPDGVAVAPDGKTLYVANADNNGVAVIDIGVPGQSHVKGFIPTGWYPSAVAVTPDSKTVLVGVGKGNQTRPNPFFPPGVQKPNGKGASRDWPYIGTTLSGALSIVPVPDDKQLAAYTATVYRNCPYSDRLMGEATPTTHKTVIPAKVGDPCPIKHVLYIIKENRTYDQVFGDIKGGNGDPSLVMFGESVTPNHHKLAQEFVLLDNLYCNGQVSRDGHPWSTMAYNTDYIARDWTLTYSGRKGIDDDDNDSLSRAPSGYLWDSCARHGLTYRSYGEYGHQVSTGGITHMEGRVPGLVGHVSPDYGIARLPGQKVRDTDRVDVFIKEFRQFEKDGTLPRFMVMSLGEDHTTGTKPGTFTPSACVASNDIALGRLVEAVSHSKYWPQMAIFVIEDDAQNGPDHVDAHRTVGLVISPYVRRRVVDSSQYSTVSMIRTMELILGLPPLSQYDAAARPMFGSFQESADLRPYDQERPRIDLQAINPKTAYGADRAAKMDFREYDRVNDFELNEILWRSIKGKAAPLPPAVRRALASRGTADR